VAPERHQTLGATLEWSHSLLTPDEQTVLRRVAVFAGSFRLDTGLAVATGDGLDESAALDALCALVDKSLLHIDGLEPPRYRLLETTRMFAVERLENSTDGPTTRHRFCQAIAELAAEAEAALYNMADRPWLRRYLPDYDNIRSAFEQACEDRAVDWGADLATTWAALDWMRGDMQNRRVRLPAAAALLPSAQGLSRIKLLRLFSTTFATTSADAGISRVDAARELVALCRERGDPQRLYEALGRQAAIAAMVDDKETVNRALAEARGLERAEWPDRLKEKFCQWVAGTCAHFGDAAGWEREVRFNLALAEQSGFENSLAYMQLELAGLAMLEGDAPRAVEYGRESLDSLHRLGLTTVWGLAATNLCCAQVMTGDLDGAVESARAAQPVNCSVDVEGSLYFPLALLCARSGRMAEGACLLGCFQAWCTAQRSSPEGWQVRLSAIIVAELQSALGGAEFERLHATGAAMTGDEPHRLLCSVLDLPPNG
jgi:hypothetical protein